MREQAATQVLITGEVGKPKLEANVVYLPFIHSFLPRLSSMATNEQTIHNSLPSHPKKEHSIFYRT